MDPSSPVNQHVNVQDDHARSLRLLLKPGFAHTDGRHSLIRSIGAASTVLLRNTGNVLPLKAPGSIAVIGEKYQTAQYIFTDCRLGSGAGANPAGPNACVFAKLAVYLRLLMNFLQMHRSVLQRRSAGNGLGKRVCAMFCAHG